MANGSPANANSNFWIMIEHEPRGPFDIPTIQRKLSAGEIDWQTLVCPLGSHQWAPADNVIERPSLRVSEPRNLPRSNPTPGKTVHSLPIGSKKSRPYLFGCVCICIVVVGGAVILAFWPSAGHNLAIRTARKGDIVMTETRITMSAGTVTCFIGGQNVTGSVDFDSNEVLQSEVLQVTGKEPSMFRNSFPSAISKFTLTLPTKPATVETIKDSFHGQTVWVEKIGGAWKQRLRDGNPTPAQANDLRAECTPDDVYPDRRLTVGETWIVKGPQLRRFIGSSPGFQSFQGHGTFKFLDIVARDNVKCALIYAQIEAKGSTLDNDNREGFLDLALSGHIYRSLKFLTDEGELIGQLKVTATIVEQGHTIGVTCKGSVTVRLTQKRI